jgi:hypothetical protein
MYFLFHLKEKWCTRATNGKGPVILIDYLRLEVEMASEESEIKTFQDFLEKINRLPSNPKYSYDNTNITNSTNSTNSTSSINASSSTTLPHSNTSVPLKGNPISVPPPKPTSLLLTLKPLRGSPQSLRVAFTETVQELRKQVAQLFGIEEVERCRLIRGGKALSDDEQTIESVFGLVSESQTLHVLEKPPQKSLSEDWKLSADHKIWGKIENILKEEGNVSSALERANILEKFRKSLL